ncbi:acyl-CoA dehydrogenase family protein [Dermacoccaceae bacterium W4C1]
MDFTIDSEQKALRDTAREVAGRHTPDLGGSGDVQVGPAAHDPKLWSALAEIGALGLPFAEEVGGFGASPVEVSLVAGELGRAGVQSAYPEAMTAGWVLSKADGQSELLEAVAGGEKLVVTGFAEPHQAWSPLTPTTTASGSGDSWTLTGTKSPVLFGEAADAVVVTAKTEAGTALFLVDASDLQDRTLTLEGTAATLLAGPEQAQEVLVEALCLGIVTVTGEAVGAMEAALKMTVEYLKTRKQFGVPLMTFQTLTQRAADMYVSVELARSAALYGAMTAADVPGDGATASRVKAVVGQSGRHVGQEAIQLHGGIGMTAEYGVGHLTSRLTAIEHTFGDTRAHLSGLAQVIGKYDMVEVV